VLRECQRVLRAGGRLAVLVIEATSGLGEEQAGIAAELGPAAVHADAPLEELVRSAGFHVRHIEDVTDDFEATTASIWDGRRAAKSDLREAEGFEAYETETGKKARLLEGIRRGLLRRTLVVAEKP